MKENKIKIKTPNLEEQNVTGNLTAVFTTSKATTRMTDILHIHFSDKKKRGSYSSSGLTLYIYIYIYCTTLKFIIVTPIFKFMR